MPDYRKRSGFSLVEVCVATALFALVIAVVLSGTTYSMKKSKFNEAQNELDLNAQMTIESLRSNMRLSSLDEMYFYPEGSGPYTAISFPLAKDDDGDGLFEKDADGKILWDKTVVYHIWPGSPHQLRITTFSPRDNTLTDEQRQEQLDDVVDAGGGSSTYNGDNASSKALFENLLDWTITPRSAFDAYAATLSRDSSASVGYCLMGPGEHEVEFEVTGKNAASTGYKIGLDSLVASTSGGKREAEALLPVVQQSGATAVAQYMEEGAWGGNYQLSFPATAVGQKFTLSVYNDLWLETNFRGTGHRCEQTKIEFDETLSPKDFVVKLDGNDIAWEAATQTGDSVPGDCPLTLTNGTYYTVRTLVRGGEMANGGWLDTGGGKCRVTFSAAASTNEALFIKSAKIGECVSSLTPVPTATSEQTITFSSPYAFSSAYNARVYAGSTAVSDWINLAIDKDKSYLITYAFYVPSTVGNYWDVRPQYWEEFNGAGNTCYYRDGYTAVDDSDWTTTGYETTSGVLGVGMLETLYEADGTYTSPIYDTQMTAPVYSSMAWDADVPSGCSLGMKVRTGVQSDLSDATAWSNLTASASSPAMVVADQKRYVQFQATLQANSTYTESPLLKDVTINWPGEERMVDIGGIFTKGPDYGTFGVKVDGEALRSAVVVKLEIYKDVYGIRGKTKRVSSDAFVELRPRNSGK